MRDTEKNRCPERARKRAASDLRCAVRKLGLAEALRSLAGLAVELCPDRPVAARNALLVEHRPARPGPLLRKLWPQGRSAPQAVASVRPRTEAASMTRELRDTRCDLCGLRRHGLVTMELAHDWHPCLVRVCSSCRYYEAAHLAPVGRSTVTTHKGDA